MVLRGGPVKTNTSVKSSNVHVKWNKLLNGHFTSTCYVLNTSSINKKCHSVGGRWKTMSTSTAEVLDLKPLEMKYEHTINVILIV